MPLEPYLRGETWWARGRVELNGQRISGYYRASTGASTQLGAQQWCAEEEARVIRRHLLGEETAQRPLTFAEAVLLYEADVKTGLYLDPLLDEIGELPVKDITPRMVRDLGPRLMPVASTDTWVRQIITPIRSVINNAHEELGGDRCPPMRVKGYDKEERLKQDAKRGRKSRVQKTPGSWEWLLRFRQHADRRHAALALTMYVTGARISQAVAMHPKAHLDLQNHRLCIPGAKGHDDRWISIPTFLVVELANLPVLYPRGVERKPKNARVFGFADRSSPRKGWATACKAAKIPIIPFHAAGRHGFGQEMNVRQPIDEKAAGAFGGWDDTALMRRTYTHAEEAEAKVHLALETGLKLAEAETGFKITDQAPRRAAKRTKN